MAKRKASTPTDAPVKDSDFLTTALSRWRTVDTAEEPMRKEGQIDLEFLDLKQWDADIVRDRGDSRPCLTIDQIGEPYRQLVGQQRQAKPAIQINPVDNGADIDTAEVFQGLIRHIEVTGGAKAARDEAFKGIVGPGWSYYRIITDYDYDQSDVKPGEDGTLPPYLLDQCIKYQAIENPFTVFRDPACPLHEPEKARFCFIVEDVPTEEFKRKWPNAAATSAEAFAASGLTLPEWYPENSVRVADYFYVEESKGQHVVLLQDGRVVPAEFAPPNVPVIARRFLTKRVVKLAKITGAEILEGNEVGEGEKPTEGRKWEGSYIPVIPMYGESIVVNGKRTLRGIVRPARDAQRSYNYQVSELVYELALSPKSKIIMAEGQDEGYEDMYKNAPTTAFPALKYVPKAFGGELLPPPQVAHFTDATKIQALTVAINQFKADLRSTLSFYDPSDPSRKNADQSGKAILARQQSMDAGSVNYKDNFGQALLYEGKVLLDLIPKIYNRPGRILRIVGLEDETQTEEVVYGQPRKSKNNKAKRGVAGIFQWGAARFDVTVSIGASYTTRRQEAADWQLELMKVLPPQMAAAMAPITVRNMDGPGNREIADRLDRTLPPQIKGDDGEADPQAMQAQLAQMQQKQQQDGQVIQMLQEHIKTEQVKQQATVMASREKAAADVQKAQVEASRDVTLQRMKDATAIAVATINARAKGVISDNELELDRVALAHEAAMNAADAAHEQQMAAMQHEQALEQGEAGVQGQLAVGQQAADLAPQPGAEA